MSADPHMAADDRDGDASSLRIERIKAEIQIPVLAHKIRMLVREIHNEIARWPVEGSVTLQYLAVLSECLHESGPVAASRIDEARNLIAIDGLTEKYKTQLHALGDRVTDAVAYRTDDDVMKEKRAQALQSLTEISQNT